MKTIKIIAFMLVCVQLHAQNTWTQKANFTGSGRQGHSTFEINNKIYIVGGWNFSVFFNELWEFDPASNIWTQKASFPGPGRRSGVAFAIGNKGYYGAGDNGASFSNYLNDFYEYDPALDTWIQKTNFAGAARYGASAFTQNGNGYVGFGSSSSVIYHKDIWMYNPVLDSWTPKANFPGTARRYASTFNIGTKTYMGTGQGSTGHGNTFYEYDYVTDTWIQKSNYPPGMSSACAFNLAGKGYILTGYNGTTYQQTMYEYNSIADAWTQKANFGGGIRGDATGISVNGKGYLCAGYGAGLHNDMWEYSPSIPAAPTASFSIPSSNICIGSCINITDKSANSPDYYTWDLTGSGTQSVTVQNPTGICYNTAGTYTITQIVSNPLGTDTLSKIVNVVNVPSLTVTAGSSTVCAGKTVTLTAVGATNYTWVPGSIFTSSVIVSPTVSTTYTVTGRNSFNCTSTKTLNIMVSPRPTISVNSGTLCAGKTFTINPTGAPFGTYTITGGSAVVSPTATSYYSVTATSSLGCLSTNTAVSQVTVSASPTVSAVSGNTLICSGQTVTLSASGATTYTWMPTGTGSSITVTPNATTNYTVTGTSGNCSNFSIISQSVTATPVLTVSSSAPLICSGETATLTVNGASSYTWMPSDTGSSITVSPNTTTDYTVTGTSGNCSNFSIITQSVTAKPVLTVTSSAPLICSGETATLTASGASSYTWMPSGSGTSIVVSPTVTTDYTITGESNGCSDISILNQSVSLCTIVTETLHDKSVMIYPNPFYDKLIINTFNVAESKISLYNALGLLVSESQTANGKAEMELFNQSPGIYIIRVGSFTVKVIKK